MQPSGQNELHLAATKLNKLMIIFLHEYHISTFFNYIIFKQKRLCNQQF